MLKGVMRIDDAKRAVDAGCMAISVSNHGGNNLDGTPATIRALPAIAEAVGDQVEVLLDGGVRRGSDVVKALALGARAVAGPTCGDLRPTVRPVWRTLTSSAAESTPPCADSVVVGPRPRPRRRAGAAGLQPRPRGRSDLTSSSEPSISRCHCRTMARPAYSL